MHTEYHKFYSEHLGRDMECKVYGHGGKPMLFIPCQDGRYFSFEDFHMAGTLAPWIDSGKLFVVAIDTIDLETWSNKNWDNYSKARRHEAWMSYIFYEAAPFIQHLARVKNGWSGNPGIIAFGCSLGATHAANLYFRKPDIFDGLLALSGIYTANYGFEGYMDEVVYQNSPVDYMANLPGDHPYISMYNNHRAVICVGQGAWEIPDTTLQLKSILESKGIHTWVDVWGYDCTHDWPWWYKQVLYFIPWLLYEY